MRTDDTLSVMNYKIKTTEICIPFVDTMKKVISILFVLLIVSGGANSQSLKYSRIQMSVTEVQINALLEEGIALDCGVRYEKGVLYGEFSENELETINQLGIGFDVLFADITQYYQERIAAEPYLKRNDDTPVNFSLGSMGGYLTHDEILSELDKMRSMYPHLISEKQVITEEYTTHNGNYMYWVKISDNPDYKEDEYEVLFTGLHHAREPNSMMQLIYLMWYMLENYETSPEIQYLVNNFETYFIPCVNPDGYIYNQQQHPNGGGMWRKNCRDNNNDGIFTENADGVDLNRNYPYKWAYNNSGSSGNPQSTTYRGPSAASEPETQMVMEFTNSLNIIVANNHHTYSNLLLYPWAYDEVESHLEHVFDAWAEVMTRDNNYTYGHGWEILYASNGGTDDWMLAEHDILAFTGESGDSFWPPPSEIIPICAGNIEMNLFHIRLAGLYAEVRDLSPQFLKAFGELDFEIYFLGHDTSESHTVYIESDAFKYLSDPIEFSDYQRIEKRQDAFEYVLHESYSIGDSFTYWLCVDNGLHVYKQQITKQIGKADEIFYDPCDGLSNWTTQNWNTTSTQFYSPPRSITDSPNGNYTANTNSSITLKNPIDLSEYSNVYLTYHAKWDIEKDWDYVQIRVSVDNGNTWVPLHGAYTSIGSGQFQPNGQPLYHSTSDWVKETISLQDFEDNTVVFRFTLRSDQYVHKDGFYFDDFTLIGHHFNNIVPEIVEQNKLNTYSDMPIDLVLSYFTVEDGDSEYPADFMLFVYEGSHYTVSNNSVIPEKGFSGSLFVPVRVHDGYNISNEFLAEISIGDMQNIKEDTYRLIAYPNPATDYVIVEIPAKEYQLFMYDILGNAVSFEYSFEEHLVRLMGINKGIYMLHVQTVKGNYYQKIIIM